MSDDHRFPLRGLLTFLKRSFLSLSRRGVDYDSLNQFVVKLKSDLDLLAGDPEADVRGVANIRQRVAEELRMIETDRSFERNWNRANHVQKLLVSMYAPNAVEIELQVWLERSRRSRFPGVEYFESRIDASADGSPAADGDDEERSALLLALVDNVQQVRSRHYITMRYAKVATARVGVVFGISFAFFLVIMSLGHWVNFS